MRVSMDRLKSNFIRTQPNQAAARGILMRSSFCIIHLQITSLQHLKDILPGSCNLFHALKYGDKNDDRTLDISETFELFSKLNI